MSRHDPHWPTARDWLDVARPLAQSTAIGVVGVPLHVKSLTPSRSDRAPAALRDAMQRMSSYDVEHDRDLRVISARDFGDLPVDALPPDAAFTFIVKELEKMLTGVQDALILLGGDNSITRPGFHALRRRAPRSALLTLDAHFDLRSLDGGLNNGNPISALLADGLPGSAIAQIGIQPFANSREYADVARSAGIRFITMNECRREGVESVVRRALEALGEVADQIYVDTDLDVLDRSLVPGTPGARPGGMSIADLRTALLICGSHPKVRVIDFVEFDPTADVAGITAYSGAVAVLSFVSGVLGRARG